MFARRRMMYRILDNIRITSIQNKGGRYKPVVGLVLIGIQLHRIVCIGPRFFHVGALVNGIVVGINNGEEVKLALVTESCANWRRKILCTSLGSVCLQRHLFSRCHWGHLKRFTGFLTNSNIA